MCTSPRNSPWFTHQTVSPRERVESGDETTESPPPNLNSANILLHLVWAWAKLPKFKTANISGYTVLDEVGTWSSVLVNEGSLFII